jgi:hypothetical protein
MNQELLKKFHNVETDGLPEFNQYNKPLEMGLWILWVAKEKLNIKKLTAMDVVGVIVGEMEVSINLRAIVNAFNRAVGKIHMHKEGDDTYYEIMNPGKEWLVKSAGTNPLSVHYFEPGKKYKSKNILATDILADLKGALKIVDPYVGAETLDILSKVKNDIQFLTKLDNLSEANKNRFQRELQDFRAEYPNVTVRDYSKSEIHDRYIISSDKLIVLGHSMKDLGSKESFAIKLGKQMAGDIFEILTDTFNRRWKIGSQI